jgi:hypothetical protein
MYRKLAESSGSTLGYEFEGRISEDDVEAVTTELERAIEEHGKARLLIVFDDLEGVEPKAIWEDLKFTPRYLTDVERFAFVGDEEWHEWVTAMAEKISRAEARFFTPDDLVQAWAWIRDE